MTLEEYTAAVVQRLQEVPFSFALEDATAMCEGQPKSMKIFHANETVDEGARLIVEGWNDLA